ncbi:PIR Superfamily Protein [Plasmodium ovale curtisi]|uniref:PIR Superfamily Protein n=1 Tax=Plasmodium ovale curtisi TaxID=864141 RepID=A0A1A8X6S1_PLAOA|nr:PIR Superfamily Protein [Plasmodium ovale curtisi]
MLYETAYKRLTSSLGYPTKELFSESFYQDREIETSELYKYYNHCDAKVADQYKDYTKEICKNILYYLEKSKKMIENISKYDECILLNNWDYNPENVLRVLPCHDDMVNEKARLTLETSRRELEPGSGRRGSGNAELASGSETKTTTETTHIGTKVGHSVLSFAHYTPIVSWIRKLGGINPNSINDMDGFSSYIQESSDMLHGNTENYISYQPM